MMLYYIILNYYIILYIYYLHICRYCILLISTYYILCILCICTYRHAHAHPYSPVCVCEFERTNVDNSQSRPATHRCRAQRVPCSVPKLLRPGLWMSQWLSFFGSVWPWPMREYLMFLHCFNCSIGPGIFWFIFVLEGKWKTCHHQGHIYTLFFQNKDTTCISTQRSQR